ncbi:LLM class flavin-dependent oxidoreductase [Nonomuraea basaltis]|uniref:LLM class flavin-dependent oxidoreductase n=1 Tax=Nonomuraea basaltis TaxID=2495887 RepID=UPI00110C4847|nr:LLM class flavin-dependent oxidoreductase [Nonomuraea basaltis]TMR91673.1 LLM class flavin-dependent oxidoreductase [Nonomuraea basaltis]
MTPKVGVFLPARESLLNGTSIAGVLDFAEQAEKAGFDSVWTGDSLLATPVPEPLTLLSAAAARTTRITIGTAALLPVLRNPITLAGPPEPAGPANDSMACLDTTTQLSLSR